MVLLLAWYIDLSVPWHYEQLFVVMANKVHFSQTQLSLSTDGVWAGWCGDERQDTEQ